MGVDKISEVFTYVSKRDFPCHWFELAAPFRSHTTQRRENAIGVVHPVEEPVHLWTQLAG